MYIRHESGATHDEGTDCWHCACAECLALRTDANEAVRS